MNRLRVVFRIAALGALLAACQGRPGADARAATDERNSAATTVGQKTTTPVTTGSGGNGSETPPPPAATSPNSEVAATVSSAAATAPSLAARPANTPEGTGSPELYDDAGHVLPQTEDKPTAASPSLNHRLTLLVRAIAEDNPELALPSFFPVEAYAQVKAIEKPERDWKRRLVAAFERNIHEYHRQLGADASQVQLARLEVPEAKIKWMKPGSEGNRVGYYRVVRSKLVVTKRNGRETALEVTSMISWRGQWYVVHLHGFE